MAKFQNICPSTIKAECDQPHFCWDAGRCRHTLVPPIGCLHFVGFRDERFWKGDVRYWAAVRAFGHPDICHRVWDTRAQQEIGPYDVAVFADGDENSPVREFTWDDSHHDIVYHGGLTEGKPR